MEGFMKFADYLIIAIMAGWTLLSPVTTAATAAEPTKVTLGTATPGGGFPVYGEAFVAAIQSADSTLVIEARNTKGSAENIPLLETGKLDIALVQGESAYEALNGIGRAPANLRILTAMYSAPGMFVVKASSPVRTIADLKGKPVAFGAAGSGLVILARYVLDGLGLDQTKDFGAVLLEKAGDGPLMVGDGRVEALWGGGIGWPGFMAVAKQPGGARFIVPDTGEIARIQAKHPFLKTLVVPANTYPGQDTPITSVGSWSFVLVRPDLDEAVAYRLAKALHAAEADLAKRLPQASETTARNTVVALPKPELLHPGVARYFRDAGVMK
jgi:uncharacterized protein